MIKRQFIGYVVVSSLNFIITSLIFYCLLKILFLNYLLSLTVTWVCSVLITFFLNLIFIFKKKEKLDFENFIKYALIYLFSFTFNLLSLKYLKERTNFDPYYIQFILIPGIVIINFTGIKLFVAK
jgi:putative flippase GtrA